MNIKECKTCGIQCINNVMYWSHLKSNGTRTSVSQEEVDSKVCKYRKSNAPCLNLEVKSSVDMTEDDAKRLKENQHLLDTELLYYLKHTSLSEINSNLVDISV